MSAYLQQHWDTLTHATIPSVPQEVVHQWFTVITTHYSEAHRFYHTLTHISDLLSQYDQFHLHSPVICYAIWFHEYPFGA
jgi:predicted metal-dependent HD superfamily phosphohydrolase